MRMSLLLRREPFAQILERTLSDFWTKTSGSTVQVRWRDGLPHRRHACNPNTQIWIANKYLNSIFTLNADPRVFEPVRKEYAHSTKWWRAGAQTMYTQLALASGSARWLSLAFLETTPAIPNAHNLLIVPGNHKIRILDYVTGTVYCMQKYGFSPSWMEREISGRNMAERCGIPVPELISYDCTNEWYCERYMIGTPLNRLNDPKDVQNSERAAIQYLRKIQHETVQHLNLQTYSQSLHDGICALLLSNTLITASERQLFLTLTKQLIDLLVTTNSTRKVPVTFSHGDLQPGNILFDGTKIWLIDLEYSGMRIAGYDEVVYRLQSRHPNGLATRMAAFVQLGFTSTGSISVGDPLMEFLKSKPARKFLVTAFMLEELLLGLQENSEAILLQPDDTLNTIYREIAVWLLAQGKNHSVS